MTKDQIKADFRFGTYPAEILDLEDLEPSAKLLYIVLCSYTNAHTNQVFPSNATLAKKTSLSVRSIQNMMKVLEERGLVKREKREDVTKKRKIKQTSNLVTIFRPQEAQGVKILHGVRGENSAPIPAQNLHGGHAKSAPELLSFNSSIKNNEEEDYIYKALRDLKGESFDKEVLDADLMTYGMNAKMRMKVFTLLAENLTEYIYNAEDVEHSITASQNAKKDQAVYFATCLINAAEARKTSASIQARKDLEQQQRPAAPIYNWLEDNEGGQ